MEWQECMLHMGSTTQLIRYSHSWMSHLLVTETYTETLIWQNLSQNIYLLASELYVETLLPRKRHWLIFIKKKRIYFRFLPFLASESHLASALQNPWFVDIISVLITSEKGKYFVTNQDPHGFHIVLYAIISRRILLTATWLISWSF